ncbi:MAG: aspartate--tRNA ligase [Nanohaloarchaea archaeon]|nr:aspartate--tRNA ligase [Candidatus Nanohaloarchaea archaeon]
MKRTHRCGELRKEDVGEKAEIAGWIHRIRNHGGKRFVDLRDRNGLIQTVMEEDITDNFEDAADLGREYVIKIEGEVRERPEEMRNEELETGDVEVSVESFEVVSDSEVPPFSLDEEKTDEISEEIRMEHRYLDMRRQSVSDTLQKRHQFVQSVRNTLNTNEFLEIETPELTKSSPEGARDFIVPSRNEPGNFYALPQSPQLFKQLLMVGGVERYYQLAKCFRDEDTRKDRQPEFTQIDIEVSFMDQEDFLSLMEKTVSNAAEEAFNVELETPVDRISWQEAMDKYGTDRPDRRYGMELHEFSSTVKDSGFNVFSNTVEEGGVVKGFKLEGKADDISNRGMDEFEEVVTEEGVGGLVWIKLEEDGYNSPVGKYIEDEYLDHFKEELDAEEGDVIFIVADERRTANEALGSLRRHLGEKYGVAGDEYDMLWVVDFPLFGYEDGNFDYEHHPFTMPQDREKVENMDFDEVTEEELLELEADAYDLVLNGFEIGGGSKRIHDLDLQRKVFDLIGLEDEEVEERFGWFLEAFKYGAPPHRGLAFGLERILMILQGEPNIREVIPFPKSKTGKDHLTGAPAEPRDNQLEGLGLEVKEEFQED